MTKESIEVKVEKCTECMCCQLICSIVYSGAFNPEQARIVINPPEEIRFTDDCAQGCALCAQHCVYSAITIKGGS